MPKTGIVRSVVLVSALALAFASVPQRAAADHKHRERDRREVRHERHEGRRYDRDGRYAVHNQDRHWDRSPRYYGHGRSQTRVDIRIGGPGGAYCAPPAPVVYYPPPAPVVYYPPPAPVVYCPPAVVREYYDPYYHATYASLALFAEHAFHNGRISVAWVIENGRPVYPCRYMNDRWVRSDAWWD